MFTVVAIFPVQRPDNLIVDGPRQALGRPVYAVLVEPRRHLELRRHGCRPVIAARDSLAKVVCLHVCVILAVVVAAPLPINLISSVRHEDRRGDDACPGGGLHRHIHVPVVEIRCRPDIRCIEAFFNWEDTAVRAVGAESSIVCDGPAVLRNVCGGELGEISVES